jgi:hypothetical protein
MNVSIKETMVDIKTFNGVTYISDVDCNRIINRKQRTTRGKTMSKEKLVDLERMIKISGMMYYPLMIDIDDCYYNNVML